MKFFCPYLPAFGLNKERSGVSILIQSECVKVWTRITLNTDTFHAVAEDTEYSMIYLRIDKYNHKQNLKTTKTATLVIDVNKRSIGGFQRSDAFTVQKRCLENDTFNGYIQYIYSSKAAYEITFIKITFKNITFTKTPKNVFSYSASQYNKNSNHTMSFNAFEVPEKIIHYRST